jgi:DNA-directed RNA polymerase specialized sigma24 family protein
LKTDNFETIATQFEPLISNATHRALRQYRGNYADLDDARQVALLALFEAIEQFDEMRGSFPAFAKLIITRRLANFFQTQTPHVWEHRREWRPVSVIAFGSAADLEALVDCSDDSLDPATIYEESESIMTENENVERVGFLLKKRLQNLDLRGLVKIHEYAAVLGNLDDEKTFHARETVALRKSSSALDKQVQPHPVKQRFYD